jgi:hypothetical protein
MCDCCHKLASALTLVWVGVSPRYLCAACVEKKRENMDPEYRRFRAAVGR